MRLTSAPEHTRANASGIYAFVNGRPVRDPLIRQALLSAYRDVLPRGRFPIALVFLMLAPERVDVNVHPAKWEVRFSDPQSIHQLIRRAVRAAMESRSWLQPSDRSTHRSTVGTDSGWQAATAGSARSRWTSRWTKRSGTPSSHAAAS